MCVKSAHLSKRKREMKTEKEGEIKHELCHFQNNKVQSCVRYIWSSKAISNSLFPIAPAVTWLLFVGEKMTTKTTPKFSENLCPQAPFLEEELVHRQAGCHVWFAWIDRWWCPLAPAAWWRSSRSEKMIIGQLKIFFHHSLTFCGAPLHTTQWPGEVE